MLDLEKARARDASLARMGSLDTAAAVGLDKMAQLAQFVAGSRYAAIHLLDGSHQHRVAAAGALPLGHTPVTDSMCLRVVEAEQTLNLPDAVLDPYYAGNPYTSGPEPVRFFSASPLRDGQGVTIGTLCVFDYDRIELSDERLALLDVIAQQVGHHLELHSLVRDLGHSATHDALTGLPNRTLLSDRLSQAMARRGRSVGEPALALIDLDGFKAINDEFGHQAGDAVLVHVGRKLIEAVRDEDTVARLSGDEFVVLFDELVDDAAFDAMRDRLAGAFDAPLVMGGSAISIRASIGIVRSEASELGYALLGRADAAMYEAKPSRSVPVQSSKAL